MALRISESHPALLRLTPEQREEWTPYKRALMTRQIEELAHDLAQIPDVPLTILQAKLMRVIVRELVRRAKG